MGVARGRAVGGIEDETLGGGRATPAPELRGPLPSETPEPASNRHGLANPRRSVITVFKF